MGPGTRLLHDDRRRARSREAPRSDLRDAGARHRATFRARRDARNSAAPPNRAICIAGRTAPGISSRWSTTASSTASWRHMPRAWAFCATPTWASRQHAIDAETTPLRDPEHYQYDFNLRDIAEVWRRGSVIASWLLDLTATALVEGSGALAVRRPRFRFGRRPLDDQGRHRRRRARAGALRRAVRSASARAAKRDFQDKLLSAMRYQFGGHLEKPASAE